MAPLFQRRSLLIRDDEPDYSVRASFSSHAKADGAASFSPPPIRSAALPPEQPLRVVPKSGAKPRRQESAIKRRLGDLTDQARDLTYHLKEAGKSRIATLVNRLAKNLAPADEFAAALASASSPMNGGSRPTIVLAEEQRWQEYEASQREEPPLPFASDGDTDSYDASPFPSEDPSAEILRIRAERVLTEIEAAQPELLVEQAAAPSNEEIKHAPSMERNDDGSRGKYGDLVHQLDDGKPQNWNGTSEEPEMQQEHSNNSAAAPHLDGRTRSVTLDSDNNTINITKESRFSGQLKFSGTIVVDGEVDGELEAARVIVREGGTASARISGDSILILGRVTGDAIARREVEVEASGKLTGDIITPELKLHPGAIFKGRCTVGELA